MNEQVNDHSSPPPAQANADVVALIKRLQQQVDFLEKKIDTLIRQSQDKPFREKSFQEKPFREKPFRGKSFQGKSFQEKPFHGKPSSKPFWAPYGSSQRRRKDEPGQGSQEHSGEGRPSGKHQSGHHPEFGQKKKFFQKRKKRE